ncbi:MAG: hypothetical protein IJM37_07420 [Lachnospiraceae bacterium]|nr:hypothetical protein [Lachnospiraceae bacterium]
MYKANRTKNPFLKQIIANAIYVLIAAMIVGCGVYALIKGEAGKVFYPIVFFLAAILNFTDGIPRLFVDSRSKNKKIGGVALCVLGVIMLMVAGITAYTVW